VNARTIETDMTDNRTQSYELVHAGSYIGPIILGLLAGNALYGLMSGAKAAIWTMPSAPSMSTMSSGLNVLFLLLGGYVAWVVGDVMARAGWTVFSANYAVRLLAPAHGLFVVHLLTSGQLTFGILLTLAGIRQSPRIPLWIPASVFLIVLGFAFAARHYADVLLGNRSVL
jgi:hypothetical protein